MPTFYVLDLAESPRADGLWRPRRTAVPPLDVAEGLLPTAVNIFDGRNLKGELHFCRSFRGPSQASPGKLDAEGIRREAPNP
jgi:hypothetical protein